MTELELQAALAALEHIYHPDWRSDFRQVWGLAEAPVTLCGITSERGIKVSKSRDWADCQDCLQAAA